MAIKKKLLEVLDKFKKIQTIDQEAVKRMQKVAEAAKEESKTLKG